MQKLLKRDPNMLKELSRNWKQQGFVTIDRIPFVDNLLTITDQAGRRPKAGAPLAKRNSTNKKQAQPDKQKQAQPDK